MREKTPPCPRCGFRRRLPSRKRTHPAVLVRELCAPCARWLAGRAETPLGWLEHLAWRVPRSTLRSPALGLLSLAEPEGYGRALGIARGQVAQQRLRLALRRLSPWGQARVATRIVLRGEAAFACQPPPGARRLRALWKELALLGQRLAGEERKELERSELSKTALAWIDSGKDRPAELDFRSPAEAAWRALECLWLGITCAREGKRSVWCTVASSEIVHATTIIRGGDVEYLDIARELEAHLALAQAEGRHPDGAP